MQLLIHKVTLIIYVYTRIGLSIQQKFEFKIKQNSTQITLFYINPKIIINYNDNKIGSFESGYLLFSVFLTFSIFCFKFYVIFTQLIKKISLSNI